MEGVVVADPGAIAEIREMASGLAMHGMLSRYVSPVAVRDPSPSALQMLPQGLARRFERELGRRLIPEGVPPGLVRRAAAIREVVHLGAKRAGAPARLQGLLISNRNHAFD